MSFLVGIQTFWHILDWLLLHTNELFSNYKSDLWTSLVFQQFFCLRFLDWISKLGHKHGQQFQLVILFKSLFSLKISTLALGTPFFFFTINHDWHLNQTLMDFLWDFLLQKRKLYDSLEFNIWIPYFKLIWSKISTSNLQIGMLQYKRMPFIVTTN